MSCEVRLSRRHPEEDLPELAYADDIALLEDTIKKAEQLLHRVEVQTQSIGLFLNAEKTKYIHLNPSSEEIISSLGGQQVEMVDEFLYFGGYTNTTYDID